MSIIRSHFSISDESQGASPLSLSPQPPSVMQLRFQPPTDLLSDSLSHSLSHSLSTSPATSSYFSSGSLSPDDEEEEDSYFGRKYVRSPASFSDLEDDDGNDSDATLDDADFLNKFGCPLERMPPREGQDGAIAVLAVDADHEAVHEIIYHRGIPCSSNCPSPSLSSESSMTSSVTDYHAIIDEFLNDTHDPFDGFDSQNFITYDPSPFYLLSYSNTPLMIKRISRASTELPIYLELNSVQLRNDPWNPCPHVLRVVNHDPVSEHSYLFMERLSEYNTPPMTTVSHYLDFFRQTLEGLSFLHEHDLVGFCCSDPRSFMADLSCGPRSYNSSSASLLPSTTSLDESQGISTSFTSHLGRREDHFNQHDNPSVRLFDRSAYPVKYYFVNFTRARRVEGHHQEQHQFISKHNPHVHLSKRGPRFKQDVKELGLLLDGRLGDMPSVVSTKLKTLVKSMIGGGFGAEDARKLFEALNRSLESDVFDLPIRPGIGKRSVSLNVSLKSCRGAFGLEPDTASLSS